MVRFSLSRRLLCIVIACSAIAAPGYLRAAGAQDAAPKGQDAELIAKYNAAYQAFAQGKWSEAASSLDEVLHKLDEKDVLPAQLATMYYTVGAAYYNAPDYPNALKAFHTYLTKFPNGEKAPEIKISTARAYLLSKQYTEALAAFEGLESMPTFRDQALLAEAQCDKELGKTDDQIRVLERLLEGGLNRPGQASGALTLIELYAARDQADKALKLINALNAKPALIDNIISLNGAIVKTADGLAAKRFFAQALDAYRSVRTREEVTRLQEERINNLLLRIKGNIKSAGGVAAALTAAVQENNRLKAQADAAAAQLADFKKLPDYDPSILLREAKAWYNWDRKWECLVALDRLLRKYPQSKEREPALFSMAVTYADVERPLQCQNFCQQYLHDFKTGPNAATVGYLLGATAMQANDPKNAETCFGRVLQEQPKSPFRQEIRFQLAGARFAQGLFSQASDDYLSYLKEFPNGQFVEEANFRIALAAVFAGKYEDAMARLNEYLKKFPGGRFNDDAKYRLMVCKYAAQAFPEVISDAVAWQRDYPNDVLQGEVLALKGDALAAQGDGAGAVVAYEQSSKLAATDEVLNYSLFEAGKLLQKQGKWPEVSKLFEDFVREKPDHPSAVAAMYWIGKARAKEGKVEEAKQFLVEQLKKFIGDPKREAVEQVIDQLAQLTLKRPRSASPEATPPPWDAAAELDREVAPLRECANATASARILYAEAAMAGLLKKSAEHDRQLAEIGKQFKPDDLSPVLLAQTGDALLAQGEVDRAGACYRELKDFYPKSAVADYAYTGLGEIAFDKKDYRTALPLFTYAADELVASKAKEATIGKAKTLLELGRLDEARKLFEQVASVREWRGEATAYAFYSLGQVEGRQGHWDQAAADYQKVTLLYGRYLPWVAKSYLAGALSEDKLGKRPEAISRLKEMLGNEKIRELPETQEARNLLAQWGVAA